MTQDTTLRTFRVTETYIRIRTVEAVDEAAALSEPPLTYVKDVVPVRGSVVYSGEMVPWEGLERTSQDITEILPATV